jgi:uncharacterized protein YkwD
MTDWVKCRTAFLILSLAIWISSIGNWGKPLVTYSSPIEVHAQQVDAEPIFFTPDSPDYTGCGGINVPVVNPAYEQEVVVLVNQERAKAGLPPLKRIIELDEAARYHAADMAQDIYFEHDSYDRVNDNLEFVCSTWERINTYYPSPRAENIAAGYATPDAVMNGWMNSSGHRKNILSTSSWEIGVGYFQGGSYGSYWVQDFGRPQGRYPLIINQDAVSTDSRSVSLYIYGGWTEIRLRNDEGEWSQWMPFQSTMDWELAGGVGQHTVRAEMHTDLDASSSSDTIMLTQDENPPTPAPTRIPVNYADFVFLPQVMNKNQ